MDPWTYEPARDLGLPPVERARSLRRAAGLVSTAAHLSWHLSAQAFFTRYPRRSVDACYSIPVWPPFVMIANHTSHLDALVLASVLPWRLCDRLFPVAAGDDFCNTPRVVAVRRHAAQRAAD